MHSWGDALRIYFAHGEQFGSHTMQNDPCLLLPHEARRETEITRTQRCRYTTLTVLRSVEVRALYSLDVFLRVYTQTRAIQGANFATSDPSCACGSVAFLSNRTPITRNATTRSKPKQPMGIKSRVGRAALLSCDWQSQVVVTIYAWRALWTDAKESEHLWCPSNMHERPIYSDEACSSPAVYRHVCTTGAKSVGASQKHVPYSLTSLNKLWSCIATFVSLNDTELKQISVKKTFYYVVSACKTV